MTPKEVYLDNSATTRVYPEVAEEVRRIMEEDYGNPSSLHRKGTGGERVLNASRRLLADLLGVKSENLFFTSGGTESNNLAILGMARRNRRKGNHLITTTIEHSSVLEPFHKLLTEGFEVTFVEPDPEGHINPLDVAGAVNQSTVLVSVMHVNNEIGSVQPIADITRYVKKKNPDTLVHVDAVQSFTKLYFSPEQWGVDALTLSGHKFHGPKGTGALYLREGVLAEPLFGGGGHEKGLRPGTENTPDIAGMALAARLSMENRKEMVEALQKMKEKLLSAIAAEHPWMKIIGPSPGNGAPHIANISFPGLKGEVLLHALEEQGVYVSTGSACGSREKKTSHVLEGLGLGLDEKTAEGALRFSFSFLNTPEEIEYAASAVNNAVHELKLFSTR